MPTSENVHEGHRQRLKNKFLEHGIDIFDDYQVLELILFYAIPKRDTNETAHRLIDKFGSLKGVLEADYNDLMKVTGIKENSASLIKLFQMTAPRYLQATFEDNGRIKLDDKKVMLDFCKTLYMGDKCEKVYAIALDNNFGVIGKKVISEGMPDSVDISPRLIADFIIKSNSSIVILVHNHPDGISMPSKTDVAVTSFFYKALDKINIELYDHVVVGSDGAVSMRNSRYVPEIW